MMMTWCQPENETDVLMQFLSCHVITMEWSQSTFCRFRSRSRFRSRCRLLSSSSLRCSSNPFWIHFQKSSAMTPPRASRSRGRHDNKRRRKKRHQQQVAKNNKRTLNSQSELLFFLLIIISHGFWRFLHQRKPGFSCFFFFTCEPLLINQSCCHASFIQEFHFPFPLELLLFWWVSLTTDLSDWMQSDKCHFLAKVRLWKTSSIEREFNVVNGSFQDNKNQNEMFVWFQTKRCEFCSFQLKEYGQHNSNSLWIMIYKMNVFSCLKHNPFFIHSIKHAIDRSQQA